MSSYFPFSTSTPSTSLGSDDPHLEVTVHPSASAFYAGETFSVTITFRNTRPPPADTAGSSTSSIVPSASDHRDETGGPSDVPHRRKQIGLNINSRPLNAEAGPSRTLNTLDLTSTPIASEPGYPYSSGANPTYRAPGLAGSPERDELSNIRSPDSWKRKENGGSRRDEGHARRTRSLALGKGGMSPQEMVWALGGQSAPPPPLPTRRLPSTHIPSSRSHYRKISVATSIPSPPPSSPLALSPGELPRISETLASAPSATDPSRPSPHTTESSSTVSSASRSAVDLNDEDDSRTSSEITAPRPRPRLSPSPSSPLSQSRTPSYQNAYGASNLGIGGSSSIETPPSHPSIRHQEPRGSTTILWAYTHLVAHFHPSNSYIPPDPLLPLRSLLLHQPVGSGALMPSSSMQSVESAMKSSSSRWQLSFGTGTIGNATQPSLTGSLFGLAKDLVYGGSRGSLEEERKRVWNMKDLPVLDTSRSLLGVDVRLKEGESRDYVYTIQLPTTLPPTHRGKAFRFTYDLVVSFSVALPGKGKRQKTKEISVPIRIWANVSVSHPFRTYDVLKPVIQGTVEGEVLEQESYPSAETKRRSSPVDRGRTKGGDTEGSLQAYAKHLLETLDNTTAPLIGGGIPSPRPAPLSPSRIGSRPRNLSPAFPLPEVPEPSPPISTASVSTDRLDIPFSRKLGKGFRPRQGSFVDGDDELVEEGGEEGGCGEAVEILSRHSAKTSYDIAKDGELVAVLTMIKTVFRLGETVLCVVTFNESQTERRVLKFSAFLESHEIIPENLLPFSASSAGRTKQPPLARLHAEHRSAYVISTSRMAFSLDIPSDATPAFSIAAGTGGFSGGWEWRVRLAFLVASPPHGHRRRHNRASLDKFRAQAREKHHSVHLLPVAASLGDSDNHFFSASSGLSPMLPVTGGEGGGWQEMRSETVECEVPVKVLAGNTAFVVRPSVYAV